MNDEHGRWYTVGELAKMFSVKNATIREWIKQGEKFPSAFRMGTSPKAQWRIPVRDVQALAQKEHGSND